jgi:hypothetical protein
MTSSGEAQAKRLVMAAGRAGVACCLLPLTGCSLLFVDAPPARPKTSAKLECTSNNAAPVIDTVVAGFQVVRTGVALAANDSDYRASPISRGADIALGIGLTTLFISSAAYGYGATSRCSEMKGRSREGERGFASDGDVRVRRERRAHACTFDAQCSGTRICQRERCTDFEPPP